MPERKPIFYDKDRRRWRWTRRVLRSPARCFTVVLVVFMLNVVRNPELPELLRPDIRAGSALDSRSTARRLVRRGRKRKVANLGAIPQNYEPLRAAFYVSDDYTSLASLQLHYRDIDLLIPEALHAVAADGRVDAEPDPKLTSFLQGLQKTRNIDLPVMSMVNNYDGKTNDWCPPEMLRMLANPSAREHLAAQLEQYADAEHQPGSGGGLRIAAEIERKGLRVFYPRSGRIVHQRGLKLMVALPAADFTYDYKYIASQSDAIILMNYDFHWPTSDAGPIAPQDWFERNIENMIKLVPPDKIVMGIANYGYDWPAKTPGNPHPVAQGGDVPAGRGDGGGGAIGRHFRSGYF